MSTRTIIGVKNVDGTILGAWQWNDGDSIINLLNRHFNTFGKAMSLINEGMWSSIFTQREKDEHEKWLIEDLYKGRVGKMPYRKYICIHGVYLLKYIHHECCEPQLYSSYESAIKEDIGCIYLFDSVANIWRMNQDI